MLFPSYSAVSLHMHFVSDSTDGSTLPFHWLVLPTALILAALCLVCKGELPSLTLHRNKAADVCSQVLFYTWDTCTAHAALALNTVSWSESLPLGIHLSLNTDSTVNICLNSTVWILNAFIGTCWWSGQWGCRGSWSDLRSAVWTNSKPRESGVLVVSGLNAPVCLNMANTWDAVWHWQSYNPKCCFYLGGKHWHWSIQHKM